jgi:hypothetical protein
MNNQDLGWIPVSTTHTELGRVPNKWDPLLVIRRPYMYREEFLTMSYCDNFNNEILNKY